MVATHNPTSEGQELQIFLGWGFVAHSYYALILIRLLSINIQ